MIPLFCERFSFSPNNTENNEAISGIFVTKDQLVEKCEACWLGKATILDNIVGTFSYVFFKVLKNFHNQELTCKTLSV